MRCTIRGTIVLLAMLAAAGCGPTPTGGDGDGDGDGDAGGDGDGCTSAECYNECASGMTTITGRVVMPNGIDPVPQAIVYVPRGQVTEFPPEVRCEVCSQITDSAMVSTTTADDGSFVLGPVPTTADAQPGFTVNVVSQKGRFRRLSTVTIQNVCADNTYTGTEFELPGADDGGFNNIPSIAVATGDYDIMECVLRKIGLEDGAFDLYDGQSLGGMGTGFNALLNDLALMKSYNIIFINCAGNTFENLLSNATIRDNIQNYVMSGGRLYVTDWSYDYIEQVEEFCPIIDFGPGNDGNPNQPESMNAAAIGDDGITTEAAVLDDGLLRWLQAVETVTGQDVVSPSGTVHVEHFLSGWVMQKQVPSAPNVKVWLEGNVTGTGLSGVLPLTTTFDYASCGRGLYSSYHTLGRDQFDLGNTPFPSYCPTGNLSPQERVLEYLILEIADCIDVE